MLLCPPPPPRLGGLTGNPSAWNVSARSHARFVQRSTSLTKAYFETATMTLIKAGQALLIDGVT